jgi:hypothetical protein
VAQQRIAFEWLIEDDRPGSWLENWVSEIAPASGLSEGERFFVNGLIRGLSLLVVVFCAAAAAALTPEERERQAAQTGIEFALRQEQQAWRLRDRAFYETLIDPNVERHWESEWRDYWRDEEDLDQDFRANLLDVRETHGVMQALVVTEQPTVEWWQTSPVREQRFYRRQGQNWLRTIPPPEFWGERQSLKTAHLRFVFYEQDAASVAAAAATLEQAYLEMYQLLGLDVPPTAEPLTVSVVPRPVGRWAPSPYELEVTSPLLSRVPEGQTDAEFLAYDIMGWFTYRALRDATPGTASRYLYRWPILVWGLRGWLRNDLLAQPSPWQDDALAAFRARREEFLPLGLVDVTELRGQGRPSRDEVIARYLAAESFIHYVVDTHGRDRLAELLAGLVRYGSVGDLIPELYGTSTERFVAEWNLHVLANYVDGPVTVAD